MKKQANLAESRLNFERNVAMAKDKVGKVTQDLTAKFQYAEKNACISLDNLAFNRRKDLDELNFQILTEILPNLNPENLEKIEEKLEKLEIFQDKESIEDINLLMKGNYDFSGEFSWILDTKVKFDNMSLWILPQGNFVKIAISLDEKLSPIHYSELSFTIPSIFDEETSLKTLVELEKNGENWGLQIEEKLITFLVNIQDLKEVEICAKMNGEHISLSPLRFENKSEFSNLEINGNVTRNRDYLDLDKSDMKALGYLNATNIGYCHEKSIFWT